MNEREELLQALSVEAVERLCKENKIESQEEALVICDTLISLIIPMVEYALENDTESVVDWLEQCAHIYLAERETILERRKYLH